MVERLPPTDPDVVVLGAGPNGLTAAAYLARAGLRVMVLEANATVGGAVRTAEVTLPGFRHDLCSGFYPLAPVGPLGLLPLRHYGLEWCHFARPYGGGVPGGAGVCVHLSAPRSQTAEGGRQKAEGRRQKAETSPRGNCVLPLGASSPWLRGERLRLAAAASAASFEAAHPGDGAGYLALWDWWRRAGDGVLGVLFHPLGDLAPLLGLGAGLLGFPPRWRRPFEFGQLALAGAREAAAGHLRGEDARVWFIGSAMHSDLAPEAAGGGLYGLVLLGLAQVVGMPVPRGGAQVIPKALRRYVEAHGGGVLTGRRATCVVVRGRRAVAVQTDRGEQFAARRAVLATVEPQQLFLRLVGEGHLPGPFVRAVRRFRWGTGVFKLDCALSALPSFAAPALQGVGVLHLGDSVAALSAGANAASRGLLPARPLLVAGIHTLADPTRAPPGGHTLWIETHVPVRIEGDEAGEIGARTWPEAKEAFADRVLAALERHAPGIMKLVLGRYAQSPLDLEALDANLVGGDLGGGSFALDQQLVFRPVPGWFRHRTPLRGLYLGGASTHPGGGVHGACGANAARVLLRDLGLAYWTRRFDP